MDYIAEQEDYEDLIIKVYPDDNPESPRDEWSNLGTMTCYHGRYQLGDVHDSLDSDDLLMHLRKISRNGGVCLPLYLYDHSGITMATTPFSCSWDSGQVGWIHVTGEKIRQDYNVKRISPQLRAKVKEYLQHEVETYNQYLTGDIHGYIIEDQDGEVLDSCWGFYGSEYAMEEAKRQAKYLVKDTKDPMEQEVA